jgi:hypothetical protein
MATKADAWDRVEVALYDAKGIAFDTCHKIYVLMDDDQMTLMEGYGYDPLISADTLSIGEMVAKVQDWYEQSCMLRFVSAVSTNHDDPNAGFVDLIAQGEEFDDEDYDEE